MNGIYDMEYPSKLIEKAVNEISKLPGIGKKTALRLALHLLKQDKEVTHELADSTDEPSGKNQTLPDLSYYFRFRRLHL